MSLLSSFSIFALQLFLVSGKRKRIEFLAPDLAGANLTGDTGAEFAPSRRIFYAQRRERHRRARHVGASVRFLLSTTMCERMPRRLGKLSRRRPTM